MKDDPTSQRRNNLAQAYQTANEAISISVTLGVLVGGGYWLDLHFDCRPLFIIVGTLIGFLACGFSLRALLRRLDQQSRKESSKGSDSGDGHSR